jgi:hypothetical protein
MIPQNSDFEPDYQSWHEEKTHEAAMTPKSKPIAPMSPLLIHKANAQDLAMQIRDAANRALRAARKGAALEANFEDNMRPVLQDAAKRLGVEIDLSSQVKVIGARVERARPTLSLATSFWNSRRQASSRIREKANSPCPTSRRRR